MTVKVIKKKPDASVIKRKICKNCGATLEYTPKDVKHSTGVSMGEFDSSSYIGCPNCRAIVYVRG